MTVRVTQVFVEVLTTRGTPLNGYADGTYDFDFTTYLGYADAAYLLDAPTPLNGYADEQYSIPEIAQFASKFHSEYVLEGLRRRQVGFISSYTLDAPIPYNSKFGDQYVLNKALTAAQGWTDVTQALDAYEAATGFAVGAYTLQSAFSAMNAAFVSVYNLPNIVARTGWADVEYVFDAFVPATGYSDSAYDLLARLGLNSKFGSTYILDALAALEAKRESQYQLAAAYKAVTGYLDSLYELQVLQQLNAAFNSAFDLDALEQLQAWRGDSYALQVGKFVSGFAEAQYVLNAYLPANGFADAAYDVFVYTALNGWADGAYDLLTLLQAQGWADSNYFLDVTDAVYTWVVNQNTGAPYRYENHDFHSFGKIGSDYLGAKADGIYLLDGDDDGGTPIDAIASTGRIDFGSNRAKRVLAAYLGVDSAGQVNLTLRTDAGKSTGPYQFRTTPTGQQVERVKFAKGLKSRYWEFDIENVLGGEMSIDEIQFDVLELVQRLKR